MKKIYIKPVVRIHDIEVESLLAGSITEGDTGWDNPGDGSEVPDGSWPEGGGGINPNVPSGDDTPEELF